MPKFGAGPNPFKGKEKAEKADVRDEGVSAVTGVGKSEAPPPPRATARKGNEEESVKAVVAELVGCEVEQNGIRSAEPEVSAKEAAGQQPGAEKEKNAKVGAGWISRISSLRSSFRLRLWKPRKSAPQPRPIQGELSLDNIKPVRNDLSETDLEVVPLRITAVANANARQAAAAGPGQNGLEGTQVRHPQPREQDLIEAGRT